MNNFSIRKEASTLKNRITVKSFKYAEDMYKFLNKQYDNSWKIMKNPVKSGVYFEQYNSNTRSFNLIDVKRLRV
jgi:hypothetical protein|tara:strand:- start:732 stop:953 length:222 start_codon:yes stop_codon:yes gene_type:complete